LWFEHSARGGRNNVGQAVPAAFVREKEIESVVKTVPGTTSAYAERVTGGYYLDIAPDRMALARYGLGVGELQDTIGVALVGGVWLMYLLGYNLSVAVAVGFIALVGVAAETVVVMLIYLDHALGAAKAKRHAAQARCEGRLRNAAGTYSLAIK